MPKNIKMLKDTAVSPNGYDVEKWLAGEVHYDVRDDVAADLMDPATGAAVEVAAETAKVAKPQK